MQTYAKFRPTGFDPAGAFLDDDRQDWLVLSVSQTRDSGPLDRSNFETAQKILADGRDDPEDFEIHRFGHWGPGWFEIIIVQPGSRAAELAEEIESRMENYPVLDDEDFSRREWEEFESGWKDYGRRDLVRAIREEFEPSERLAELIEDAPADVTRKWWMSVSREPYFGESSGVCIPVWRHVKEMTRDDLAALVKFIRKAARETPAAA